MASLGPEAWNPTLTGREQRAAGMTTSQPEGVGRISRDAEGPKAQPPLPLPVSVREPLTLLDYLLLAWTIGWLLAAGWVVL